MSTGVLKWDVKVSKKYKNDFFLQVFIWFQGIYYAERHGYNEVYLNDFQNKKFQEYFDNDLCFENNTCICKEKVVTFRVSNHKTYKTYLLRKNIYIDILEMVKNAKLRYVIMNYINTFPENSLNVLDLRGLSSQSLKVNQRCDPELNKYNLMLRISPGSDIMVFKDPHQPKMPWLSDLYNIVEIETDDDNTKQCLEMYMTFYKKINDYYCTCLSYSTKMSLLNSY